MTDRLGTKGYNRSAQRRAVNHARKILTGNLSGTVETFLAANVREEQSRKHTWDERLDEVLSALNARHERDGSLSDEFANV
jgi:post-segregation antitoxin (ccd killing protein)